MNKLSNIFEDIKINIEQEQKNDISESKKKSKRNTQNKDVKKEIENTIKNVENLDKTIETQQKEKKPSKNVESATKKQIDELKEKLKKMKKTTSTNEEEYFEMAKKGETINGIKVKSGKPGAGYPKGSFVGTDDKVYNKEGKPVSKQTGKTNSSKKMIEKVEIPKTFEEFKDQYEGKIKKLVKLVNYVKSEKISEKLVGLSTKDKKLVIEYMKEVYPDNKQQVEQILKGKEIQESING